MKDAKAQKVLDSGSNLKRFLLAFLVDDRTMNKTTNKGDRSHRATWNLIPLDKAEVPDLSVRRINSICGGGDSRDPTMNEQVMAP